MNPRFGSTRGRRLKSRKPSSDAIGLILLTLSILLLVSVGTGRYFLSQGTTDIPKALIIVNRHGARSALGHFSFENFTWEIPLGQLSRTGMQQAFEFGTQLSLQHYQRSSLTPMNFENFKIYASFLRRTQETARGIILGIMYGLLVDPDLSNSDCGCHSMDTSAGYTCIKDCLGLSLEEWTEDGLPEIEVLEEKSEKLGLLLQHENCQGWLDQISILKNNGSFNTKAKEIFSEQFSMVNEVLDGKAACVDQLDISTAPNQSIPLKCMEADLDILEKIWDDTVCAMTAGKTNFTKLFTPETVAERLKEPVLWKWHHYFSAENGPLCGGMLVNEILKVMVDVVSSWEFAPRKIQMAGEFKTVIFSGHDTTIASLLAALKAQDWHYPPFLAHITFTLMGPSKSNKLQAHWVKIHFDDMKLDLEYCLSEVCYLPALLENLDRVRVPLTSCKAVVNNSW